LIAVLVKRGKKSGRDFNIHPVAGRQADGRTD